MTVRELLADAARRGIRLEALEPDRLRIEAPAGVVTSEWRAAVADRKADVRAVVWRVEAMRRLAVTAPRPVAYARESAQGGPGRCFSCGDPLDHPAGYGRCVPCDIAADIFYVVPADAVVVEVVP